MLRDKGIDLGDEATYDRFLEVNKEDGRVRALVKEFVPGDSGVNSKTARKILRDIRALNKLGIYIGDVRADNFKAGRLVDFGSSQTAKPHCIWTRSARQNLEISSWKTP
jgi:hypothetical protein